MPMVWNLFLSSTVRDLKDYRRAVREVCQHKAETACLLSEEDWSGGYDDTVAKCKERVRDANAFVLLLGYWYGSVPIGCDRSITHIEFDQAIRKWGENKFPPMAVMMPAQGSAAEKKLRKVAAMILKKEKSDADQHQKLLSAFHSAVTGSWRTVTWFKDKNDLQQYTIANCWKWKGQTPLAAARGEVEIKIGPIFISQVTDEHLGRLGRETQLRAVKIALAKVADYANVPALAFLVHGNDDAGQRAFLQWLNITAFKNHVPRQRLARLPVDYGDPSVLPSWVAQLLGITGGSGIQTMDQLAECIATELKRQPIYFVLDRVNDLAGGVMGFRDSFWIPFYEKLHSLRATQQFSHRLVAVVSDYSDDSAKWQSATFELDLNNVKPNYSKLLRIPRLEPFSREDILAWFDEMEIPDEPAGRRSKLADRAIKNSKGKDDPVPTRVFERLRGEVLWPEGENE